MKAYFLKKSALYLSASLFISALMCIAANKIMLYLLPVLFLTFLMLRLTDDIFDYLKDAGKKAQPLSKRQLIIVEIIISLIYIALNIYLFGAFGAASVAVSVFIVLQGKISFLQSFFMFLLSLYYFLASEVEFGFGIVLYLTLTLIISVLFKLYKRRK